MVQKLCYAPKSVTDRHTEGRTDGRTHARMHKRPRSNMPLQLLWSWGHNYPKSSSQLSSFLELWPNIHWTSNYGTGMVSIGNMLSWLSFHNFVWWSWSLNAHISIISPNIWDLISKSNSSIYCHFRLQHYIQGKSNSFCKHQQET